MYPTDFVSQSDVADYLARIQAADIFETSSLRGRLLEHLLLTEIDGNGETLKAYTIGLDVFGKAETFDPSADSSVRVAMGRLRTAIALFESGEFADTKIAVVIPVGTYRPEITLREMAADMTPDPDLPPQVQPSGFRRKNPWRSIAIAAVAVLALLFGFLVVSQRQNGGSTDNTVALEFEPFTGDPMLAEQMASTLRRTLSRNDAVTVISDIQTDQFSDETDFVLKGVATRTAQRRVQVSVELVSRADSKIVWAKQVDFNDDLLLQPRIRQVLGNELRIRVFGASKQALKNRDPKTLTPEQLFVMATWVPGPAVNAINWEMERVRLMGIALEKDPEFGAAHSVMADKLAYLANVNGPSDTADLRRAALIHAQKARELSPLNPDVMFNVAQALWHSGKIDASEAAMRRVIDLDESHDVARFLAMVLPYTCSPPPESIVNWALQFDNNLSPDNPIRWLTLTWIGWLHTNRGEYDAALRAEELAALIFQIPYTFMRHAMLLNKAGRPEEAAALIRSQRTNWPDVDPSHFAEVTVPRLCSENQDHPELIQDYEELATAILDK